jgi:hypothetical protein
MSFRLVHQIYNECEIFVARDNNNHIRVRITERDDSDSENPNPTDIEIEGNPVAIMEAFAAVADVLDNLDALQGEPS